jgi:hypothetical protein
VLPVTCALIAGAFAGLMFSQTRGVGLMCLAGLVYLHPPVLVLLVFAVVALAYRNFK